MRMQVTARNGPGGIGEVSMAECQLSLLWLQVGRFMRQSLMIIMGGKAIVIALLEGTLACCWVPDTA